MAPKTILLVEDDADVVRAMVMRLRVAGYQAVAARDAVSAISMARSQKPDLVILDLGLPGGDGYSVIQRMANLAPLMCIPIIVLTARDPLTDRERSLKAGAVEFIRKPADNAELIACIRRTLGETGPEAAGAA